MSEKIQNTLAWESEFQMGQICDKTGVKILWHYISLYSKVI